MHFIFVMVMDLEMNPNNNGNGFVLSFDVENVGSKSESTVGR